MLVKNNFLVYVNADTSLGKSEYKLQIKMHFSKKIVFNCHYKTFIRIKITGSLLIANNRKLSYESIPFFNFVIKFNLLVLCYFMKPFFYSKSSPKFTIIFSGVLEIILHSVSWINLWLRFLSDFQFQIYFRFVTRNRPYFTCNS